MKIIDNDVVVRQKQSKAKQSKVKLGEGCSLYAHQIFKQ